MAYTSEHLFKKILKVQEITKQFKADERTLTWIFKNHIKEQFFISMPTFKQYLGKSPRELKATLETIERKQGGKKEIEKL